MIKLTSISSNVSMIYFKMMFLKLANILILYQIMQNVILCCYIIYDTYGESDSVKS